MIFLSCLYDGQDPSSYEGIELRMGHGAEKVVFNTGNPAVDYLTAHLVIRKRCKDAGGDPDDIYVGGSSSLDHFVMDGGDLGENDEDEDNNPLNGRGLSYLRRIVKKGFGLDPIKDFHIVHAVGI